MLRKVYAAVLASISVGSAVPACRTTTLQALADTLALEYLILPPVGPNSPEDTESQVGVLRCIASPFCSSSRLPASSTHCTAVQHGSAVLLDLIVVHLSNYEHALVAARAGGAVCIAASWCAGNCDQKNDARGRGGCAVADRVAIW